MKRDLLPRVSGLISGLTLLPAIASGQIPPAPTGSEAPPTEEPPLEIDPLLPRTGEIFQGRTWIELGRALLDALIERLPSLFTALVVLLLFFLLAWAGVRILRGVLQRSKVDPALGHLLLPLVRYTIIGLGVIMALSQAGLNVGSLLAGVGVAGLALGLAAQDTLANIVAGFTILSDRPFRIGDRVTIADHYGQIVETGVRSTRLRTLEHLDVILPNKEVIDHTILNHTLTENLRLGVPLSIAYRERVPEAREALLAACGTMEGIKEIPEPEVVVTKLADSGVELELRLWLENPQDERQMRFRALERAKEALDEAGIQIPFPQRTLHVADGTPALRVRRSEDEDQTQST